MRLTRMRPACAALTGSILRPAFAVLAGSIILVSGGCAARSGAGAVQPETGPGAPPPSRWAERTLRSLSLREKVGQMMMPWVGGDYAAVDSREFDQLRQWVQGEGVGGVVMSVGLPHSYAAKLNELQRMAKVPLLVASDMENGPGMRMSGIYAYPYLLPQGGGTAFPPLMGLGAAGSDSLAFALGRATAAEARAVGVHVTFGPVLDVNSNPLNPIINTRSFGEDPALVARLGRAYVRGAREGGLLTTAKHFPGHGDAAEDSHLGLPAIQGDRARLDAVELAPFRAAVAEGIDGVMTAHIAAVGVLGKDAPPATLSPYFMTAVLRGEMGFRGLLYTDALDMGGVVNRYGDAEAAVLSVEAGADVLLMPRDVHVAVEAVVAAVRAGRISESRIDRSVLRILEDKARAGLDRTRLVDLDAVDHRVGTRAHEALAMEIARRSITLARDERGLVPLAASARRVLVVTYAEANDPISGIAFARALERPGRTIAGARADARTTDAELAALRAQADSADVVIVAAFVSPLERSGVIGVRGVIPAFVEELSRAGKPVVAVSFGTPYLLDAFASVPAYLLAWGGEPVCQEAAARALLGEAPITGRLPVSLPPWFKRGDGLDRPGQGGG
ncbi:MAG TPA: glycoside hydrolase family 3 N-terminal domain-containing protein [Longimicrobium sp.]